MTISVDTNVLVRMIVGDDAAQERLALATFDAADQVMVSNAALCELVWVLRSRYKEQPAAILAVLNGFLGAAKIVVDRGAVRAGLETMDAGGDFADGVIAYEGSALGAETFVSFDRTAIAALAKRRVSARLLE